MKPTRVALLGGSFNPPHVGHLLAASYVKATQPVDEVWLVPSFRHPFGKPLVEFEHRVKMCQAICGEVSGWLVVCDIERELGGDGRTVDTLKQLGRTYSQYQFRLVIGSDILKDLPHWKDFAEVERRAPVLVLYRPGYPSSRAVGPPLVDVSSSEVRRLLEGREDASQLVPRTVLDYARSHHLYGL